MVVGKYDIQQPTYTTCYANGLESTLTETFKNGNKCFSEAKFQALSHSSILKLLNICIFCIKAIAASYSFT